MRARVPSRSKITFFIWFLITLQYTKSRIKTTILNVKFSEKKRG
jgi:hypothetical protein